MLFVTMKTDTDRSYRTLHHLNPLHRHHRHPHLRLSCPPQVCPRLRRTVTNLQEIIPLRKPRPLRQCPLQHRNSTMLHQHTRQPMRHITTLTLNHPLHICISRHLRRLHTSPSRHMYPSRPNQLPPCRPSRRLALRQATSSPILSNCRSTIRLHSL